MSDQNLVPFPQVIVLNGPHKGDVFVIDHELPVVFGSRLGVKLPEPALAGVHCQIVQTRSGWFLMDLGSPAGTWLGDERVEGIHPIEFGRTFRIGDTHLAFLLPDPEEPADPDFIHEAERALRAAVPPASEIPLEDIEDLESAEEPSFGFGEIPEEAPLPGLEDSAEYLPIEDRSTSVIAIPDLTGIDVGSSGVIELGRRARAERELEGAPGRADVSLDRASKDSAAHLPAAEPEGAFLAKRRRRGPVDMSATDVFQIDLPGAGEDLKPQESFGDYDVLQVLGRGSLGPVYKCYDRRRKRVVTLKLLDAELGQKKKWISRFLRGAKAGSRLQHRSIVATLGAGHAQGRVYVVCEYVEGLDLEQFCLAREGRLPARLALQIAAQITEALVYAHGRRVIHRAVSPSNVLIGAGGAPKLADLAFAKLVKQPRDLRMSGQLYVEARSPYAPPESLLGGGQVDARADIYGLGALLFRCLTGAAPYGQSSKALVPRLVQRQREPWGSVEEVLSPELRAMVERCLDPDPAGRFPASRDLRDAIADLPETALL